MPEMPRRVVCAAGQRLAAREAEEGSGSLGVCLDRPARPVGGLGVVAGLEQRVERRPGLEAEDLIRLAWLAAHDDDRRPVLQREETYRRACRGTLTCGNSISSGIAFRRHWRTLAQARLAWPPWSPAAALSLTDRTNRSLGTSAGRPAPEHEHHRGRLHALITPNAAAKKPHPTLSPTRISSATTISIGASV